MIALLLFVILVLIVYYVRENNKVQKGLENIPFVSSLPFIWATLRRKPHDEMPLEEDHDIYMIQLGSERNIIINNPEYARDLLIAQEDDAPKASYPPGNTKEFFGQGIPFSNSDLWRIYRRLASPTFNNGLYPELVGGITLELFNFMREQQNLGKPYNIYELMQRITIETLGRFAFGHRFNYLESVETPYILGIYKFIIETVLSLRRLAFPWIYKLPTETNRRFTAAIKEFDKFIFDVIDTRRNEIQNRKGDHPSDRADLLTSMLELSKEEGIYASTKQLRDELVSHFVAGHDTTALSLSVSLYHLAKYPEMQERARQEVIGILGNEPIIPTSEQLKELKYVNAIIKEALRAYPPITEVVARKLSKPIRIGPYLLPENVLCKVNLWQIHHHPKYWENPNQFDPERFLSNEKRHPASFIPFSSGPRNCVGQNFALLELRVILSMFLLKYTWTLPEDSIHKDKLILKPFVLLRPLDLKLVLTERNGS